jgi:hypothetical protein
MGIEDYLFGTFFESCRVVECFRPKTPVIDGFLKLPVWGVELSLLSLDSCCNRWFSLFAYLGRCLESVEMVKLW